MKWGQVLLVLAACAVAQADASKAYRRKRIVVTPESEKLQAGAGPEVRSTSPNEAGFVVTGRELTGKEWDVTKRPLRASARGSASGRGNPQMQRNTRASEREQTQDSAFEVSSRKLAGAIASTLMNSKAEALRHVAVTRENIKDLLVESVAVSYILHHNALEEALLDRSRLATLIKESRAHLEEINREVERAVKERRCSVTEALLGLMIGQGTEMKDSDIQKVKAKVKMMLDYDSKRFDAFVRDMLDEIDVQRDTIRTLPLEKVAVYSMLKVRSDLQLLQRTVRSGNRTVKDELRHSRVRKTAMTMHSKVHLGEAFRAVHRAEQRRKWSSRHSASEQDETAEKISELKDQWKTWQKVHGQHVLATATEPPT
mmetsp:Transcript_7221/g.22011  ORF Transcript_7221/g.22011 Transcript_7221/m.22011 type:complete len:371 (+) Transcript_7221:145-1257(+)|eukprot:CAMPEP_0198731630 /NCGR_PEP_ID=MMETSP1475-20131203/31097_1 /TAXON_ID= ORGANISM="Unidentified sp., Strain CCMP1999" /NCGR_SAMPLE_ID=MMETSP1475 /ASSEMBLY_ACC=CAM_ASM_001111 /LENGTH=370 /DNA_ID=CAMNT_0044494617 /DNA_START=118 /DNA_END=1230 /DNA_ORIENTATION=-